MSLKQKIKLSIGAPKYKFVSDKFGNNSFNYLDVGGGSGKSAHDFKGFFPNASYSCIDLVEEEEYKSKNGSLVKDYWKIDLANETLDKIPDNAFDFICCTHVIEHLFNGDKMLERVFSKLKPGGYIYIEYPGFRSLRLPSMSGTLNFFDDETHCRIYSILELNNLLLSNQLRPLKSGTRRNKVRILFFVPLVVYKLVFKRKDKAIAYEFWDLLGFAEYIFGTKLKDKIVLDSSKFK